MLSDDENKKLIHEIYELVLQPERYDSFMELWGDYIAKVLAGQEAHLSSNGPADFAGADVEITIHFQRAFDILQKIGRHAVEPTNGQAIVDQKKQPTVLIKRDGTIGSYNEAAAIMLGSARHIDELASEFADDTIAVIHEILASLDRTECLKQSRVVKSRNTRYKNEPNDREFLFYAKPVLLAPSHDVELLIYPLHVSWGSELEDLLEELFSLTSSEMKLAKGLCCGYTLNEIAQRRGRSVHTMRSQMKSILQKTSVKSQIDFVQKILRLSSAIEEQVSKPIVKPRHNPLVRLDIRVAKDRQMPVYMIGPDGGRPVLFIHGMLDGIGMNDAIKTCLHERNIRLIAPVRPWFDDSPPAYQLKTAPLEFARDLECILDRLELKQVPVIGHMAGSVYAFAAASILPDRISGILNVAGGIPIKSIRQLYQMAPRQRVVALTARYSPVLLSTILRSGISQIDSGNERSFMNALYDKSSIDRQIVNDTNISRAVYAGYNFAIAQGHRAFEVDSYHVTRDWSSYADQASQPTILVHGVHDPVVSIDSVRIFQTARQNTRLSELQETGQLAFYHQPAHVLRHLEELFLL